MTMNPLVKMIYSMLNDEHGISIKTYGHLYDLRASISEGSKMREQIDWLMRHIDATNERFYLPEDVQSKLFDSNLPACLRE